MSAPAAVPVRPEDPIDSSWGRAALAVLLLADGLAVGLISVFFLPLWVGSVPVPLVILGAAFANLGLVMLAARFTDRTLLIATPLIGWLVVYLLAAAGGPGGDGVLPSDWRALLLLFVGLVPAGIHLGNRALARSFAKGAAGR
ncbi:hypothetical protein [Tomitella fengzijianii]|uniref:Uncharacterized protein n=1 Tax=Tomitella fengzijianii TaxID=2597660 RepID=A0A516X3J7_9ACTN|nr:hypothetical protein [Tomitella fengzijianii]QDQ97221.1 hypothetical protein FO059_07600 [Tomitella fengzijianii]